MTIRTLRSALHGYRESHGVFPDSLGRLTEGSMPFIERIPKDGWKNAFVYLPTGIPSQPYFLRSLGEDGRIGTQDDIDVWTMDK